jgi:hypothetical protein
MKEAELKYSPKNKETKGRAGSEYKKTLEEMLQ